MSKATKIQWCDSTVNPIMGCAGCELFPAPKAVTKAVNLAVGGVGAKIDSYKIFEELVDTHYRKLKKPGEEFKNEVNTTNIGHLRELFVAKIQREYGKIVADAADKAIRMEITCYAAKQHLNRGLTGLPHFEMLSFRRVSSVFSQSAVRMRLPRMVSLMV